MNLPSFDLVATLPDGTEYFEKYAPWGRDRLDMTDYLHVAENAVRHAGLTTSRADPQPIPISVQRLHIEKGKLIRDQGHFLLAVPPLRPMTEEEFETEMTGALKELPKAFHNFVRSWAWGQGHSAGYEEVLLLAREFVDGINGALVNYQPDAERGGKQ